MKHPSFPKEPDTDTRSFPFRHLRTQLAEQRFNRSTSPLRRGDVQRSVQGFCGACVSWLNGAKLWRRRQGRSLAVCKGIIKFFVNIAVIKRKFVSKFHKADQQPGFAFFITDCLGIIFAVFRLSKEYRRV
jgi:hypothetical protein